MAIDNETKIRHLESRLREEELAAYFDIVKTWTKEELEAEIKALKTTKLQDELAKI